MPARFAQIGDVAARAFRVRSVVARAVVARGHGRVVRRRRPGTRRRSRVKRHDAADEKAAAAAGDVGELLGVDEAFALSVGATRRRGRRVGLHVEAERRASRRARRREAHRRTHRRLGREQPGARAARGDQHEQRSAHHRSRIVDDDAARDRARCISRGVRARRPAPGASRAALGEDGPFVVVAAGKAATAMFAGVRAVDRALVVIPRGSAAPPPSPNVTVIEASHPLPDESSVRAAEAALALAACDSPHERSFLISGGASSLLCAPCEGLDARAQARGHVEALLDADAAIDEINVVRRHLSRIKGGGLARACGASPEPHADRERRASRTRRTRSAPARASKIPRPSRTRSAIAERRGLGALPFVETWKHAEKHAILASPMRVRRARRRRAGRARGVARTASTSWPSSEVEEAASRATRRSRTVFRRGDALASSSPSPPCASPFPARAAAAARTSRRSCRSRLPEGTIFAAIATDGVDGASGTGGAIVDGPLDGADLALASFATGPLHLAAGTAIPSAPTGLNFTDLHVLLRT